MTNLMNKTILITGAGRGLGQTLAEAFASQGASVAANDINPIGLEQTVARIRAAGGQVKDYAFDLTKLLPVVALIQQVLDDFGRIDVLVNADSVRPGDPIFKMDEWDFHRTLDVNLTAPFFLIQRVGQVMQQQGGGVILNVGRGNLPGGAAYRASVAALEALSQAAAEELSPLGLHIHYLTGEAESVERAIELCS
jgi:3-oxoacyl-[acyl-carrier protein] reductase